MKKISARIRNEKVEVLIFRENYKLGRMIGSWGLWKTFDSLEEANDAMDRRKSAWKKQELAATERLRIKSLSDEDKLMELLSNVDMPSSNKSVSRRNLSWMQRNLQTTNISKKGLLEAMVIVKKLSKN